MNTNAQRAILFVLLALLMVSTRLHLPTSLTHFGPVPDASWAAFFLGGFYLRGWSRWAFPVFMVMAVAVDYVVISGQGMDFFAHYCMSGAYWFLVPAYFALWLGGLLLRKSYKEANGKTLGVLVASLFGSVVLCHLLSQGSFYWISDSVADPTFAGWWKNYSDWFVPYLRTTAIYVGLAVIVHVGVQQAARLQAQAKSLR
ncbi:MAG TPA: hypothetical protein VIT22_01905 [Pseudoxanthomonas sp.]